MPSAGYQHHDDACASYATWIAGVLLVVASDHRPAAAAAGTGGIHTVT
jgi:hypothetical protein